jgi:hypothetical protein
MSLHMHHHVVVFDCEQSPFTHWHNNIIQSEEKVSTVFCMTLGSHGDYYENCSPLRCDILYSGRILPPFRVTPCVLHKVRVIILMLIHIVQLCYEVQLKRLHITSQTTPFFFSQSLLYFPRNCTSLECNF